MFRRNVAKKLLCLALMWEYEMDERRALVSRRKYWVHPRRTEEQRRLQGAYENLQRELALTDEEAYRSYIRMDTNTFYAILLKITPRIQKEDTVMRKAISPGERLGVTLRFLATGESFQRLQFQFHMSARTISKIVMEVAIAIWEEFHDEYMKTPQTKDWELIANEYNEHWNFPNCIGAMDGKLVAIIQPASTASEYYCSKDFFAVVLMAIVRADLSFIYVDAGTNGCVNDATAWNKTTLKTCLEQGELNIPPPTPLPGCAFPLPYVFVTEEGVGMTDCIMRPYSRRDITEPHKHFNYRLLRAKRTVENAFGLLMQVWRIFHTTINLEPEKVTSLILCCCLLHNMLLSRTPRRYITPESLDTEDIVEATVNPGAWRDEQCCARSLPTSTQHNRPRTAIRIRDAFCDYFNTVGKVEWQDRMVDYGHF